MLTAWTYPNPQIQPSVSEPPSTNTSIWSNLIVISFDISQRLGEISNITVFFAFSRFCFTGDEKDMKTKMFLELCGDFQQCGD